MDDLAHKAREAAGLIRDADCLLFLSGAGMGVDSGIGTFRGQNAAKWLPLTELKMDFSAMSKPSWFETSGNPRLAFGYWHWIHNTYVNNSHPHEGYRMLQQWAEQKRFPAMSYTSNIDGHWLESGMPAERVVEIHGSVRYLQCRDNCTTDIWQDPALLGDLKVDADTHLPAVDTPLPLCKHCKRAYARPNVKMFQDTSWNAQRTDEQKDRWTRYVEETLEGQKVVLIECGAGTAVPTVRMTVERILRQNHKASLVRINLEQYGMTGTFQAAPLKGVSMACGALEGLKAINSFL